MQQGDLCPSPERAANSWNQPSFSITPHASIVSIMADIPRNKTLIALAAIGAVLVIAGAATWDQWAGWLAGIGALL